MKYTKYPIMFSPIPIERMWAGSFINDFLKSSTYSNNHNYSFTSNYGELWLLTDRYEDQSRVINGYYKGLTLNELWKNFFEDIFGGTQNTEVFPLLIKIIDAGDDLSLQVHPKEADIEFLPDAQSKTEMWFVINSNNQAKIWAGFDNTRKNITKDYFLNILNEPQELKQTIKEYSSKKGSYFYIPSGTIHVIGKGNLIFEIQQNSDTTYRVSDWGRVDKEGKSRKLHITESLRCINFTDNPIYHNHIDKLPFNKDIIDYNISPPNPYFNLSYWSFSNKVEVLTYPYYRMLTLLNGELEVICNNGSLAIPPLTTVLLPRSQKYLLSPTNTVELLTYY